MEAIDQKYCDIAPYNGFAEKLLIHVRDRIYRDFLRLCQPSISATILDIGISDVINDGANVLERLYSHQKQLTAVGLG